MRSFPVRWWCFLLLCAMGMPVQSAVHLYDDEQMQLLADNFSVYRENREQLTIGEVLKLRHEFIYQADNNPNYGFSENGLWLHADISNLSHTDEWVFSLNFSQLDKVDFYVVVDNQVIDQSHQGKFQPEQHFRIPVFNTALPIGVEAELFIRVQSSSSALIAPVYVTSQTKQIIISQVDNLLWGFFYGGLMILALYNFVLFLGSRELSLVGYVTYISAVLIWQFVWGGHLHFFFPDTLSPIFSPYTSLIFVIIGICSGIFSLIFLETKENAPSTHPVVIAFLWLQGAMGLVCSLMNLCNFAMLSLSGSSEGLRLWKTRSSARFSASANTSGSRNRNCLLNP